MTEESKFLATFIIIASLLYLVEGVIPRPLPWLKLGFANIATVVAIYYFNIKFVLKLVCFRIIVGSIITATFLTPTFILSFSGALFSAIVMYIAFKIFKNFISPIGVSLLGSITHLLVQLIVVYLMLIKDISIFYILPYLLITGTISGFVIGFISDKVIRELYLLNLNNYKRLNKKGVLYENRN